MDRNIVGGIKEVNDDLPPILDTNSLDYLFAQLTFHNFRLKVGI